MKLTKLFCLMAAVACISNGVAFAGESCCDKAKAKGKDCAHKCCVEAKAAGKTCEKCNAKADDSKKEDKK